MLSARFGLNPTHFLELAPLEWQTYLDAIEEQHQADERARVESMRRRR